MYPVVTTKEPSAVAAEVQGSYRRMFPEGDPVFVTRAFGWAVDCFTGKYRDYQPIDARYHDFEHTLQGTLCMSRLLAGRHRAGAAPLLSERVFQLAIFAILLHDTGYLKRRNDRQGTGAKYTVTHVNRSAEFAAELLADRGFGPLEVAAVQHMIRCTGVNADVRAIPFADEGERIAGFALATADLLGQMAAPDYVDKLPILFEEFVEAVKFSGATSHFIASFKSSEELMERTPAFWEQFVLTKLEREFAGVYRFLNDPYPDGPNYYVGQIETNLERLKRHQTAPEP